MPLTPEEEVFKELAPENLQREIDEEERAKLGGLAVGPLAGVGLPTEPQPEDIKVTAREFWGEDLSETPLPGGWSKLKRSKRYRTR